MTEMWKWLLCEFESLKFAQMALTSLFVRYNIDGSRRLHVNVANFTMFIHVPMVDFVSINKRFDDFLADGVAFSTQADLVRSQYYDDNDSSGLGLYWIIIVLAVIKIIFWICWCAIRANR